MAELAAFVDRLESLTKDLASRYQQRGDTIAQKIKATHDAWVNLNGYAITERRETARAAGSQFDALIAKDTGDIEALEIELAYVRTMIDLHKTGLMP